MLLVCDQINYNALPSGKIVDLITYQQHVYIPMQLKKDILFLNEPIENLGLKNV